MTIVTGNADRSMTGAGEKPAEKPGVVMVDGASITATVETIDYDKRTIALKGPRGNVVALKVGPDEKISSKSKPAIVSRRSITNRHPRALAQ